MNEDGPADVGEPLRATEDPDRLGGRDLRPGAASPHQLAERPGKEPDDFGIEPVVAPDIVGLAGRLAELSVSVERLLEPIDHIGRGAHQLEIGGARQIGAGNFGVLEDQAPLRFAVDHVVAEIDDRHRERGP